VKSRQAPKLGNVFQFQHPARHSRWRRPSLGWTLPWVPVVLLCVVGVFVPGMSVFQQPNSAVAAQTIMGRASVVDGDTIEIHGRRIRLFGIDAPESDQSCMVQGKASRCGQHAAIALADEIGSRVVNCQPKGRDRYGRIVAVCLVGGEDINAWMVAQGWALAYRYYSTNYISQEQRASKLKLGIWQGEFVPPWDWRRDKRPQRPDLQRSENILSNGAISHNCEIKGNVSQNGARIYHIPGDEYYSRTKIDVAKGERWFCNEAEAQAAGWRRSRR
jgi:endonuclease YncB( thermonuclease family)